MMKPHVYAAIDVGSSKIKLKIIQYIDKRVEILEDIEKPLKISLSVFNKGFIEHEMVKVITSILSAFKHMMDSYGVEKYKAYATSAFRKANNGRNVIEVISMKSGIDVEIIEDAMEKFITHLSIRDNVEDYKSIRTSAILVELNAGSCDISMYKNNKLTFNEEFILGTMVLKGVMKDLESKTTAYVAVTDEYIRSKTNHIWHNIKVKKIKHFIAIGGEIKVICRYLNLKDNFITTDVFEQLYLQLLSNDIELRRNIESKHLDWYEFAVSVLVYKTFFELVKATVVECHNINFRDGILARLLEKDHLMNRYQMFNNDPFTLATSISKRYKSSVKHCRTVALHALRIYEGLAPHFYFDEDDVKLMKLAAILHEIGKYTRMKDYFSTSFEKIKNLSIVGFTHHQMTLVAYICRYLIGISPHHDGMDNLSTPDHNRVVKLSAILMLGDSLDKSKLQKVQVIACYVKQEQLVIEIETTADIILERWDFDSQRKSFINTFGIEPIIVEE